MPKHSGIITTDSLYFPDQAKLDKWLKKNAGEWFVADLKLFDRKIKDPKTRGQLGWYWALLLPEITAELNSRGLTITLEVMPGIKRQTCYTEKLVHEGLTLACGLVGEDGKGLRLSEMDKRQSSKFLNHVLDVAVELEMDIEKLKAVRDGATDMTRTSPMEREL